jgi:hypothetical protein
MCVQHICVRSLSGQRQYRARAVAHSHMHAGAGGGARRVVLVFFLSFGTGHRGTGAQPPHAAASSDCDAGEPRQAHARIRDRRQGQELRVTRPRRRRGTGGRRVVDCCNARVSTHALHCTATLREGWLAPAQFSRGTCAANESRCARRWRGGSAGWGVRWWSGTCAAAR